MSADPTVNVEIDGLPIFAELDDPAFGSDMESTVDRLFSRSHQGLMRTTPGGYTDGSVFVYRNADVKALAAHRDLSNQNPVDYARPYESVSDVEPCGFYQLMSNNVFTKQPPEHAQAKQLMARRLTMGNLERFTEPVEKIVEEIVEEAAELEEVDFRRDVADRAMAAFWAVALNWSEEEADLACSLASTSQRSNLINPTDQQRREIDQASLDLMRHLGRIVLREIDSDSVATLRELVADYEAMDRSIPGRPEILADMFGASLLDGLHSLGAVIASVVQGLLGSPDSLAAVRADKTLVPAAFQEGVRLNPAVIFTQRQALRDFVFEGAFVPEETPVTMAWMFANRDPTAFDDPNEFKLGRPSRPQATFGGGQYICPGRNVVRFLGELVLRAVTRPGVSLDLTASPSWEPGLSLREVVSMPVSLSLSETT